jgi:hypothetical protein
LIQSPPTLYLNPIKMIKNINKKRVERLKFSLKNPSILIFLTFDVNARKLSIEKVSQYAVTLSISTKIKG